MVGYFGIEICDKCQKKQIIKDKIKYNTDEF